eukprot:5243796-Amphidinium_carterae.1
MWRPASKKICKCSRGTSAVWDLAVHDDVRSRSPSCPNDQHHELFQWDSVECCFAKCGRCKSCPWHQGASGGRNDLA